MGLLLQSITKITFDEDDDDEEWGLAMSSGCCLSAISQLIGTAILEEVLKFVSTNIQESEWQKRYSGLMALGAVLDVPDRGRIIDVLKPAVPILLNLFNDQISKVRETNGWVFSKICELHHEALLENQDIFNGLIESLLKCLEDKVSVAN